MILSIFSTQFPYIIMIYDKCSCGRITRLANNSNQFVRKAFMAKYDVVKYKSKKLSRSLLIRPQLHVRDSRRVGNIHRQVACSNPTLSRIFTHNWGVWCLSHAVFGALGFGMPSLSDNQEKAFSLLQSVIIKLPPNLSGANIFLNNSWYVLTAFSSL